MLRIKQLKHLANRLQVSIGTLEAVANAPGRYCEELVLLDPAKPHKRREVLSVRGPLRELQRMLYRSVLLPKLAPSEFSHGCVPGRDIKSNLEPHLSSKFVLTSDISNFYPTISSQRVYRLFVDRFACSPDVARICTKLCTYNYHLALGLITSPCLADQVLCDVDTRIGSACARAHLVYTRYVDDVTISGPFDLAENKSGFADFVQRILTDHGFAVNRKKNRFGCMNDGVPITKLTSRNGHPDVRREYITELERQIEDAADLAAGRDFHGPFFTAEQVRGRVQFVCWVNPRRRASLLARFRAVDWKRAQLEAEKQELCITRKRLVKKHSVACVPAER